MSPLRRGRRRPSSVDDRHHGERHQQPGHVATDPADAPGRSYIGEELVEDLDDPIGVFRPPEQSVHHDDVGQVGTDHPDRGERSRPTGGRRRSNCHLLPGVESWPRPSPPSRAPRWPGSATRAAPHDSGSPRQSPSRRLSAPTGSPRRASSSERLKTVPGRPAQYGLPMMRPPSRSTCRGCW